MQEPTNSEILRAVKAIDDKFTPLVEDLDKRVKGTELYISDQIAVAKYVAANGTNEQKAATPQPVSTDKSANPNNLAKTIIALFALFTAIVTVLGYVIQVALNK